MLNKKELTLIPSCTSQSIERRRPPRPMWRPGCCQCIDIVGLSLGINHVRSKICISPISAIFLATRPLEDYPQFITQNAQLSTMAGFKFSYERKCPLKENCFLIQMLFDFDLSSMNNQDVEEQNRKTYLTFSVKIPLAFKAKTHN